MPCGVRRSISSNAASPRRLTSIASPDSPSASACRRRTAGEHGPRGADLIETIHKYLLADLSAADRPIPALAERVAQGQLGMKSGAGFYDWTTREPAELIARRNRQIVQELAFLKEIDAL